MLRLKANSTVNEIQPQLVTGTDACCKLIVNGCGHSYKISDTSLYYHNAMKVLDERPGTYADVSQCNTDIHQKKRKYDN